MKSHFSIKHLAVAAAVAVSGVAFAAGTALPSQGGASGMQDHPGMMGDGMMGQGRGATT